jgi:acetyl esterase/lipase
MPKHHRKDAPGVVWIHGGGYILGMKEMVYMSRAMDLVRDLGVVVISPDNHGSDFVNEKGANYET